MKIFIKEKYRVTNKVLKKKFFLFRVADIKGFKYVNYRDSKLIRLFKEAFGGNCKTVMIVYISFVFIYFEEFRNILVYVDRVKYIKIKVYVYF